MRVFKDTINASNDDALSTLKVGEVGQNVELWSHIFNDYILLQDVNASLESNKNEESGINCWLGVFSELLTRYSCEKGKCSWE